MKRLFFTIITIITTLQVCAQRITREEYVETYKSKAISEMKRSGIPASITLAQGILESDCGNSDLAVNANNHFGIKCYGGWTGATASGRRSASALPGRLPGWRAMWNPPLPGSSAGCKRHGSCGECRLWTLPVGRPSVRWRHTSAMKASRISSR